MTIIAGDGWIDDDTCYCDTCTCAGTNNDTKEETTVTDNTDSEYRNNVRDYKAESEAAEEVITLLRTRIEESEAKWQKKWQDDTNVLASVLHYYVTTVGDKTILHDAIEQAPYDDVAGTLEYHDAVPEEWLTKDYEVTVTVPVSVTLVVTAANVDAAEEAALSEIESNGLDYYTLDYDLYDVYYNVEEA